MAANKRTKTEREAALAKVAELDRGGHGQVAIARLLGVSQPQVCYDLRVVRKRYRETQLATVKGAVSEKLAQLRDVRREAWEAWDRSKERGRPSYESLAVLLKVFRMECELLGLYPPRDVKGALSVGPLVDWTPMPMPATGPAGVQPAYRLAPSVNRLESRPSINGHRQVKQTNVGA